MSDTADKVLNGGGPAHDGAEPETVSKSEFARRVKLSPARITQLTRPGENLAPAVTPDGRLDLEIALGLLEETSDPGRASGRRRGNGMAGGLPLSPADAEFKAAKARKMQADADRAELQQLERQGRLVDREATAEALFARVRQLRDKLGAVPRDLAQELAGLSEPREIRARLQDAMDGVFESFAQQLRGDSDNHVDSGSKADQSRA